MEGGRGRRGRAGEGIENLWTAATGMPVQSDESLPRFHLEREEALLASWKERGGDLSLNSAFRVVRGEPVLVRVVRPQPYVTHSAPSLPFLAKLKHPCPSSPPKLPESRPPIGGVIFRRSRRRSHLKREKVVSPTAGSTRRQLRRESGLRGGHDWREEGRGVELGEREAASREERERGEVKRREGRCEAKRGEVGRAGRGAFRRLRGGEKRGE